MSIPISFPGTISCPEPAELVSWDCTVDFDAVVERVERRSEAKICIMSNRWGKDAGLGALSAFWVERRRRSRFELGVGEEEEEEEEEEANWDCESWSRAEIAIRWCARVGGLKEESRT
jgi:hypothetical protein